MVEVIPFCRSRAGADPTAQAVYDPATRGERRRSVEPWPRARAIFAHRRAVLASAAALGLSDTPASGDALAGLPGAFAAGFRAAAATLAPALPTVRPLLDPDTPEAVAHIFESAAALTASNLMKPEDTAHDPE